MDKKSTIVILVVLLILVLGAVGYYLASNKTIKDPLNVMPDQASEQNGTPKLPSDKTDDPNKTDSEYPILPPKVSITPLAPTPASLDEGLKELDEAVEGLDTNLPTSIDDGE